MICDRPAPDKHGMARADPAIPDEQQPIRAPA
jgi:hypothetical protein